LLEEKELDKPLMLNYKKVTSDTEIHEIAALAYELMHFDYAPYVRKSHIDAYLDEHQSVDAIKEQIRSTYEYYFIFSGEKLVGYIGLDFLKDHINLSKLYLCKDSRGKGFGRKIITWIVEEAREKKLKKIELIVLQENQGAIRFYQSNDFEIVGTYIKKFDSGSEEKNFEMIKSL